jgi:hypothetical protein
MKHNPVKLSPDEADSVIEMLDDYLEVVIADRLSPSIETAVDRMHARDRLKAKLCNVRLQDVPHDGTGRPDWRTWSERD